MNTKPILFSGPMIKAILAGQKTMTRRVMKPQPNVEVYGSLEVGKYHPTMEDKRTGEQYAGNETFGAWNDEEGFPCPYGAPKSTLWVRETWQMYEPMSGPNEGPCYRATGHHPLCKIPSHLWRPSIFMPRAFSRITLEITGVRVERVQDITTADIEAEGLIDNGTTNRMMGKRHDAAQRMAWEKLWDGINAKRGYSWASNPWCWVLEFRRIEP